MSLKTYFNIRFLTFSLGLHLLPVMLLAGDFSVTLQPDTATVNRYRLFKVVFVVDSTGINTGGQLQVQFPTGFGKPELVLSSNKNYVYLTTSNSQVNLSLSATNTKPVRGYNKTNWACKATVDSGQLVEGDTVTFFYGKDTTIMNYYGFITSQFAGVDVMYIGIIREGGQNKVRLPDIPVTMFPDPVYRFAVIGRSNPRPDSIFPLNIVALDQLNNPSWSYRGTITFDPTAGINGLPSSYTFQAADSGIKQFQISLNSMNVQRVKVQDAANGITQWSNPMLATTTDYRTWWGDPHTHTVLSQHGRGYPDELFRYSRDVTRLDWLAYTEHSYVVDQIFEIGVTESNKVNIPDEFVTINGYEWTSGAYGHKCVYFGTADTFRVHRNSSDPDGMFVQTFLDGGIVTAAHPSGLRGKGIVIAVTDWDHHTDHVQVNAEITGNSGLHFEFQDPYQYNSSGNIVLAPGTSLQEALGRDYIFGFTGASDNHHSRGGRFPDPQVTNQWDNPEDLDIGITAVLAPNLTRSHLFSALSKKLNYATTGDRILCQFQVNDSLMGTVFQVDSSMIDVVPTNLSGWIYGVDTIESVQLIKNAQVIKTFTPNVFDFSFTYLDTVNLKEGNAYYYMRVNESNGEKAWTTPVWVQSFSDSNQLNATLPDLELEDHDLLYVDDSLSTNDTLHVRIHNQGKVGVDHVLIQAYADGNLIDSFHLDFLPIEVKLLKIPWPNDSVSKRMEVVIDANQVILEQLETNNNATLLINVVNEPPIITSSDTFSIEQEKVFYFKLTGTDPEGDSLYWQLERGPVWLQLVNDTLTGIAPSGSTDLLALIALHDPYQATRMIIRIFAAVTDSASDSDPGGEDVLSVEALVSAPQCVNSMDASIDLQVSGGTPPYRFAWNDGSHEEQRKKLKAGTYWVNITDQFELQHSDTFHITHPKGMVITVSKAELKHKKRNDGVVMIAVQNGTPPYTYNWSNGATTKDLKGVGEGKYTIQVLDAKGCLAVEQVELKAKRTNLFQRIIDFFKRLFH